MKVGMVLGLIGGIIGLLIGAVGYGLSSTVGTMAHATGDVRGASQLQFYSYASVIIPIVGVLGAGLATRFPFISVGLMTMAIVGMLVIFGFGTISMIPSVLMGVGCLLIFLDAIKGTTASG